MHKMSCIKMVYRVEVKQQVGAILGFNFVRDRISRRLPLFSFFLRAYCPDAGPLTQSGTTALLYVCLVGLVGLFSAGPYVELRS